MRNSHPEDTSKAYFLGTHRTKTPPETWNWISDKLELIGISRVADLTGLDRLGIPVYQAVRPKSRNLSVSQGKAITRIGAKVGAAMEAAELWHAEKLEDIHQVEATLDEMEKVSRLTTNSFPWRFTPSLLKSRPFRWIEATCLNNGQSDWLPLEMLKLDFSTGDYAQISPFHLSSNGLASGNCLAEAMLHSLCELIERHANYLVQRDPLRKQVIYKASVEDPVCRDLIERFVDAGMKLSIYDITWEAEVPVILTQAVAGDLPYIWHGSGCHPAPPIALCRALAETAQTRLTCISGARDDLPEDTPVPDPSHVFNSYTEPVEKYYFSGINDLSTQSIAGDLDRTVSRLTSLKHEVYCADLSREEIAIPVVSSFSPDLKMALHV